jgi:Transposase DDE domain
VVAPGHSKVVPLAPVPGLDPGIIVKQDGAEKQDCERNAVKRWLEKHAARMKPLRPVYLADDLFACQSVVERLADNGDDFIFTCKETSHKALYDFIDGAELDRHEVGVRKGKTRETHRYRFVDKVPLRDGNDAVLVSWIGLEILDAKGVVKYQTALVTSLPVAKTNVAEIAACGRARWKIENESFNVLKNHGYELEHNFGHGQKYLAMTLAGLNMLAFAWHTVLDLLEPPWRKAREAAEKRTTFFAYLATLTSFVVFPAWSDLFEALTTFTIPPHLPAAPKIE